VEKDISGFGCGNCDYHRSIYFEIIIVSQKTDMINNVILKIQLMSLYHFGWFRWRYKPVSLILLQDRLIVNYLGFIKVRDIPLRDIEEVLVLEKKWFNRFITGDMTYFMIRMNYPLMIVYKRGGKSKTDYIVGSQEAKSELLRTLTKRKMDILAEKVV